MAAESTLSTAPALHHLWRDEAVAVIRAESIPDRAAPCHALRSGGIRTIEFTFATPDVEAIVERASRACSDEATIGVGTVLSAKQADHAIDAGAWFLVTPCVSSDVAQIARHRNVPVLMGAITPGEVLAAARSGGRGEDLCRRHPGVPIPRRPARPIPRYRADSLRRHQRRQRGRLPSATAPQRSPPEPASHHQRSSPPVTGPS